MRVAVLTLTRDRLPYTQHCFQTLRENAGCEYEHWVLDQDSADGTYEWLAEQDELTAFGGSENVGCCKGWNLLVEACDPSLHDVIVTFDNDCEVVTPETLRVVAELAYEYQMILAPRVLGLMHPPPTIATVDLGGYWMDETTILGNIFMAIPTTLLREDGFRWDERYAVWDGGESITQRQRERGGRCGYVRGFEVNHYKTTLGQVEDIPWYFARRVKEGGRAA